MQTSSCHWSLRYNTGRHQPSHLLRYNTGRHQPSYLLRYNPGRHQPSYLLRYNPGRHQPFYLLRYNTGRHQPSYLLRYNTGRHQPSYLLRYNTGRHQPSYLLDLLLRIQIHMHSTWTLNVLTYAMHKARIIAEWVLKSLLLFLLALQILWHHLCLVWSFGQLTLHRLPIVLRGLPKTVVQYNELWF